MTSATIEFDSVDLRPSDGKWRAALLEPPLTAPAPEVRGVDIIIPDASGLDEGSRVASRLLIHVELFIGGQGSTRADQEADFLSSWETLGAVFDPTASPAPLVVYGPLHGVADGKKRTVNARYLGAQPTDGIVGVAQKYVLDFESIDSPPAWVEADNP